ncbi:MAG: alpha/beta fold hydrolase [Candidatus Protochlamydia sp.]|nr:alpha/beta fold hydrolase [Candidatus Protochlamydia sp.]
MQKVEERESVIISNHGEKIFGVLHRPLQTGKAPAVVICSGFAGNKCGKYRLFVNLAKELAKNGIAVFRFDYRCSGDSEGDFKDITIDSKLSDALLCIKHLENDARIDKDRLGLLGRSLGGAIAVLAASHSQSIKSLALWAPVFTSEPWKKLWDNVKSNPALLITKDILKNLPANVPNLVFIEQFFKMDIEQRLESIKKIPLLHVHGEQDLVVKIEHARAYKKARELAENNRFIVLPNSDHDFSDESEQRIAIDETCGWFLQTLK